ncbi:MAG: pyrroline-5-carboxylate reductase [Candidatus Eisenbacteria bacterium]
MAARKRASQRLAVLGAGQLGTALIRGLTEAGVFAARSITVTTAHPERLRQLTKRYGVTGVRTNAEAVHGADVVLLTVKPQQAAPVMKEIGSVLTEKQLLISAASSVTTAFLEAHAKKPIPVVRAMPNTPVRVRQGMTGLARGAHATAAHLERARAIFGAVGRTVVVDERHIDAVTGLSASGPAFIYIVIESLADGGVKMGLPRDVALELAAQTVLGAGAMVIQSGAHPAVLKDEVTTPSGTTIDGILELEDGGLRVALIKAVVRATRRAGERAHELFGKE